MFSFFINLNYILQAFIACLFTWSITILGSSVVFSLKKFNQNVIDSLLAISAGIMLSSAFFSLLYPALNLANDLNMNTSLVITLGFVFGGLFLFLSDYFLSLKMKKGSKKTVMLMTSIMLHNIPEGLSIGMAFGSVFFHIPGVSITSALLLTLGIAIQNFPEGCAISIPLKKEGLSTKKSFILGSISGVVEPLASILGAILIIKLNFILPFFLSFASGTMIYVVCKEIIPESQENIHKNLMSLLTVLGFALMMVLDLTL